MALRGGWGGQVEQRSQKHGQCGNRTRRAITSEVLEKDAQGTERGARLVPEIREEVEYGVEGEVQQVDHRQQVRLAVRPVSEVVLPIPISEWEA